MWDILKKYFKEYPSQEKVAKLMLRYGLRIEGKGVYCGEIKITDSALARGAGVDRRVVASTIATIQREKSLRDVFLHLSPTPHLKEVARAMGWGGIEIIPTDARQKGILARTSSIIADAGISIRQAIVDDPYLTDDPHLLIVTETPIPVMLLPVIKSIPGVKDIILI